MNHNIFDKLNDKWRNESKLMKNMKAEQYLDESAEIDEKFLSGCKKLH